MFTRSKLELSGDRSRWWLALLATACLGAWVAWSSLATVAVYRTSERARVERDAHTVQIGVAGRVERVAVVVGQHVEAGDVLVELDASAARLERLRIETERDAARSDVERIESQLHARARVQRSAQRFSDALAQRGRGRIRSAEQSARHSADQAQRLKQAAEQDAIPQQHVTDADHRAQLDRAASRDMTRELSVLQREAELESSRREAEDHAIHRELEQARRHVELLEVELQRMDASIAAMRLVSPIAGEVASLTDLQPGAYLSAGAEVAVIVPPSTLRAVAWMPLDGTVGWVRPGQPARVRLHDFPWTRWGSVPASVDRIAREPEDGLVRVELILDASQTEIPLGHGLPCQVEITVDEATPADMVIRAAGRRMGNTPRTEDG